MALSCLFQEARGSPAKGKPTAPLPRLLAKLSALDDDPAHPHPTAEDLLSHPFILAAVEGSASAIDAIAGSGGDEGVNAYTVRLGPGFRRFWAL